MAIVTTNNQNYIDIADAIRAKGVSGTFKPSEMASAIVSIPAGGSSGNGVRFIDYDGRTVEEWSADSVDSKTALPSNPTHEGLIGQGWNWSLESIKSYISKYPESNVYVGQMYKTASGLSEFDITLTKVTGLTVEFSMEGNKNWGDGTSDNDTSHTYADYGDYTITCDGENLPSPIPNEESLTSSIPNGIRRARVGGNVTSIGECTFFECRSLSSITIPDGVTSIGLGAFYACHSLTSITIPGRVTSIGEATFLECYSLTSITIPDGVTSIGEGTFNNCNSLSSITITDGVTSIGEGTFAGCNSLSSITIPDGVTSIGESAFSNCSSLRSITIPDGVTSIGLFAFSDCSSLRSIIIPDGVTYIDESVFYHCYVLSSITIPDGVTSIRYNAFNSCYSLTSITIPGRVTSIGDYAFDACHSLKSITIPDGVTSIGRGAFSGCNSLSSITIPNGVTSIAEGAFFDCYACTKYDFSQAVSVPTLSYETEYDAFNNINQMAKIIVPDTLYDEWIAAENWSTYADYIYKASEITEDPIETEPDEEEPEAVE